jgi:Na+/melibiose symporter-like transporter
MNASISVRIIRWACAGIFVACIAGLIISSIAGNNAGWVLTIGMVGVAAAIILIVVSLVTNSQRLPVFSEVRAEALEQRIAVLVAGGADENEIRDLVRDAVELGRGL